MAVIDTTRRRLGLAVAALGCLGAQATGLAADAKPSGAKARPRDDLVEGGDYERLDPAQPANVPGRIEVLEFFSYACPHCHAFEPVLEPWAARLPADVAFRRVPVPLLYNADNFMRTYYALETLGLLGKMHAVVFAAVHVERLRLDKPEDIAALVARNGGDGAKFLAVFKSFSVATAVGRARQTTQDYRIDGVPTLAIGGLYITSPAQAKSMARSLVVAEALIDRVRRGTR